MNQEDLFASRLKKLRAAAGLTQKQLADRAGLTPDAVVKLESGSRSNPTWETTLALASALGVDCRVFAPGASIPESRKLALWVNDSPKMDRIWDWLQKRGIALVSARSTAKATEWLRRAAYDAIITDLRRDEDGVQNDKAGIELTQSVRRGNAYVPIFIYTMNIDVATRQLAFSSGATVITASPVELQKELESRGL